MKKIRWIAVLCVLTCVVGMLPVVSARPGFVIEDGWAVLKIANAERTKRGKPALSTFEGLQQRTQVRAEELQERFSHTRPDGSSCFTVLEGISWGAAGENIASGHGNPTAVMQAWMNSEGHRQNILSDSFTHMGVGHDGAGQRVQLFIGGCSIEEIVGTDKPLVFSPSGELVSEDVTLRVRCNMHGESVLPAEGAAYSLQSGQEVRVSYAGVQKSLPCRIGFADVPQKAWYAKAVSFAVGQKLFNGVSATHFAPEEPMTRAMFVTVLGRLHGVKANKNAKTPFTDVKKDYYTGYVKWANDNGIVTGTSETTFAPNDNVTREQICAMMVRYCDFADIKLQKKNAAVSFKDAAQISGYAKKAVKACQRGAVVSGEKRADGYYFRPQGFATRAEVATIMMNFYGNYVK